MLDTIPYDRLEAILLDVGNTLVTMDYERLATVLVAAGVRCDAASVERAEARARVDMNAWLAAGRSTESGDSFRHYMACLARHLPESSDTDRLDGIAGGLAALREPGRAHELWNRTIPGTLAALEAFRGLGLRLGVVSNSDGTVEQTLREAGLRPYFAVVADSAVVGHEKPDPRILHFALERLGARPERTLYVGDLPVVDAAGARAAGVHAAIVDPHGAWDGHFDGERVPDLVTLAERLTLARAGALE